MVRRLFVLVFSALALCGCGSAQKGAADSAHRLLAAAQKNDRVAFEAEIDRTAVRADVRRQVAELAKATALDVDGGPSEFALDRMISPDAFRLVDAAGGPLRSAPTAGQVAKLMKQVDGRHACLRDAAAPDACLLTFAKAKNQWRLVGMKATGLTIELADAGD